MIEQLKTQASKSWVKEEIRKATVRLQREMRNDIYDYKKLLAQNSKQNKLFELACKWNNKSTKKVPYEFIEWLIRELEGEKK